MEEKMNNLKSPMNSPSAEYLSVAETAKLVRAALAKEFPGHKFSVKSESYAGGASIRVNYAGGPPSDAVEAVVAPYRGGAFDGMIDMAYSKYSWLAKDGSASRAFSAGTMGSMGTHAEEFGDPHAAGCRYVRFGSDFIFVNRECLPDEYWVAIDRFERETGMRVRHEDHEDYDRVRTDRKNYRGQWVYRLESRGRKVTRLYCFEGLAAGSDVSYGFLMERHGEHIQEPPLVVAMSDVEREERARYGF